MVAGSGGIQGMGWGYGGAVVGSDSGSFRWVGMGVFNLCGSIKKETHGKFARRSWRMGIWRRLGVKLLEGVVGGGMTQFVKIGRGLDTLVTL